MKHPEICYLCPPPALIFRYFGFSLQSSTYFLNAILHINLREYLLYMWWQFRAASRHALAFHNLISLQIGQKSSQISSLKSDISTVDKLSQEANRRVQNEAFKQQSTDLADYEKQKEKLTAEITELKKSLDTTVATNRESELQLRKVGSPITFVIQV